MYLLRLYIAGQTTKAQKAIEDLEAFLDESCKGEYSFEIIDVFENPQLAGFDQIIVTPTVIKLLPPPTVRITGELSNRERAKETLGL